MLRRSPRRRTLSLTAAVVLVLALTPLAFLALSSTDQAVDRAKAIVPLPPRPFLSPSPMRTAVAPHPSAALCDRDDVECPDLAMRPPYQLVPDTLRGRRVLRVANAVMSIGAGPVEVRGFRSGALTMDAVQYLRSPGHPAVRVPGGAGQIVFKAIPAQGRIWKFQDAARFELWTTGNAPRLVRTGPKLTYCLRDLRRLWDWRRSPKGEVYPACSRSARRTRVTLGTSPGWADIYPASYYQQWIDVTGLRGCFDLTHIADPKNRIIESDETNNAATTRILLPMGRKLVRRC